MLGDFGIVFFRDGGRVTTTFERVGITTYWMAPWAYKNERLVLADINPSLDIYPLGKVLWLMISGRNGFSYWEYDLPENDLTIMFPEVPLMVLINSQVLAQCVVRHEKDCKITTAIDLRSKVDSLISEITARQGYRPANAKIWPCRLCGKGHYTDMLGANYIMKAYREGGPADLQTINFHVLICDHCKHAELFQKS